MTVYPLIPLSRLLTYIEEDAPFGDITSQAIITRQTCMAGIIAREELILAGLEEAAALFSHFGVDVHPQSRDGERVRAGTTVLSLSGSAHAILLVERTALNLMGRMSGIATRAREMQDIVSSISPSCRVAATRKTAPGLRLADKKAAMIGGADPHRFSLSDAILIKDTHRSLVPLGEAVRRAREADVSHLIEAEAESAEEALEAARAGADIILIDNMTPGAIRESITRLEEAGLRDSVRIELSGGITPETIREYAGTGADRISLGMLTHSVRNADLSLEILAGS